MMRRKSKIARELKVTAALGAFLLLIGCGQGALPGSDLLPKHPLPLAWTQLEPGLDYARLSYARRSDKRPIIIAALRVDPKRFSFTVLSAPEQTGQPAAFLPEMTKRVKALAAVNASFFLPESYRPTGLVVSGGKVLHKWIKGAGSGVFVVKDGRAFIEWAKKYNEDWVSAEAAIQAGPLIVEPGGKKGIYKDTMNREFRTAVGVDKAGNVVLLATLRAEDGLPNLSGLDLHELMAILMDTPDHGGLGLTVALDLDGGVSTSMLINHPKLQLEINSVNPVRNGLAVIRKADAP